VAAARSLGPGALVVDVGGGRGDHAAVWRRLGLVALVIDPAWGMVRRAAGWGALVARAVAEALPLGDAVADLVWFHLSLHHTRWRAALSEAARVRRPTGRIEIWTFGAAHHDTSLLGSIFPQVAALDRRRFPDPATIVAYLRGTGLQVVAETVVETVERTAGAWQAGIEARFVSTLQALDDAALEEGLRVFLARHPDPSEIVTSTLTFERVVAGP